MPTSNRHRGPTSTHATSPLAISLLAISPLAMSPLAISQNLKALKAQSITGALQHLKAQSFPPQPLQHLKAQTCQSLTIF